MRALRLAVLAVAGLGFASPAHADAEDDWNRCNTTAIDTAMAELQIAGCTARIESGEERGANLFAGFYNRASAYYNKSDYDRAITDFTAAIGLKPTDANAFVGRGLAYYRKQQFERAVDDFSQAIKLNPDSAEFYYRRATAIAAL